MGNKNLDKEPPYPSTIDADYMCLGDVCSDKKKREDNGFDPVNGAIGLTAIILEAGERIGSIAGNDSSEKKGRVSGAVSKVGGYVGNIFVYASESILNSFMPEMDLDFSNSTGYDAVKR